MARKRKRKRTGAGKQSVPVVEFDDEEEVDQEPFRPDPVPADFVPEEFQKGTFKDAGRQCSRCRWTTGKRGFSGLQAMRGHLRKHAYERKAVARPMKRQAILATVVLGFGSALLFGGFESPILAEPRYGSDALGLVLTVISTVLAVWLFIAVSKAASVFTYSSILAARFVKTVSVLPTILLAGAMASVAPPPAWYWSVPPVILLVLTIPLAGSIGAAEHGARHGKRKSDSYFEIVKPTSDVVEFDYELWTDQIVRTVRSGQVSPGNLRGAARLVWNRWVKAYRKSRRSATK